ncbi:hypothetical protein IDVR_26160 [Intrasporangium sp. DVR]
MRHTSTDSVPWVWGHVGDTLPPSPSPSRDVHLVRAVRVAAPAAVVFGWLAQLRAAPYSYDLVDNLGRSSPDAMTRTEPVELGQTFMKIFTLTAFEADRGLTLELTDAGARRAFGPLTVVYRAVPLPPEAPEQTGPPACILRCDLFLRRPRTVLERMRLIILAWGDLVMMRRQLLNLRRLSERTASAR